MEELTLGELIRLIKEIGKKVDHHDKDLYFGNHLPSITTRIFQCEEGLRAVKETIISLNKKMFAIMLMLAGAIVTGIVDIIVHVAK